MEEARKGPFLLPPPFQELIYPLWFLLSIQIDALLPKLGHVFRSAHTQVNFAKKPLRHSTKTRKRSSRYFLAMRVCAHSSPSISFELISSASNLYTSTLSFLPLPHSAHTKLHPDTTLLFSPFPLYPPRPSLLENLTPIPLPRNRKRETVVDVFTLHPFFFLPLFFSSLFAPPRRELGHARRRRGPHPVCVPKALSCWAGAKCHGWCLLLGILIRSSYRRRHCIEH